MNKGYVMLARQIVDSAIFGKPAVWLKIFIFLLIQAQHETYKKLKRGQCYTTYAVISEVCGATRNEIDHAIRFMKKAQMLATQKATRGMVVTIRKYDTYQSINHYKSDSKSDRKATRPPVCGDTEATQKRHDKGRMEECNNVKNEKKGNGRFTPPSLEDIKSLIQERGYTVDPNSFLNFYESKGWMVGRNKMKDWRAALAGWESRDNGKAPKRKSALEVVEEFHREQKEFHDEQHRSR
jgi:hypothetical protein